MTVWLNTGVPAAAIGLALGAAIMVWAAGPTDAPAQVAPGVEAHKVGDAFDLGGRRAILEKLDFLPCVENEFSRRYVYDTFENPKLAALRTQCDLDAVVAPGKDEFEKQVLLMNWAYSQIDFGDPHELTTMRYAPEILRRSRQEHKFYCGHYATVLLSAANSLGWVSRAVGIPAHCFNEIWSNQYRKWVMFDATANLYVEQDGLPLNTYEIRQAWFENRRQGLTFVVGGRRQDRPTQSFDGYTRLEYFPNTNWMDAPRDTEHMFTTVDAWSKGSEGPQRDHPKNPAVEPYFPINQAALTLTPAGGDLLVALRTVTPNFASFKVRLDGRDWAETKDALTWKLHEGKNTLEAKAVNKFGTAGPVSLVELNVGAPSTAAPTPSRAASPPPVLSAAAFKGEGGYRVIPVTEPMPAYVHFWSTPGHWLEWTIDGAAAGPYTVTLRYGEKFETRRELRLNGEAVPGLGSVPLPPTGGWAVFKELTLPARVTLGTGRNVLRLTCLDEVSVALSEIRLSSSGRKDIVIPAGAFSGQGGGAAQAVVSDQGGYFFGWDAKGHWLEWVVEAPVAGDYDLYLRYATLEPTERRVEVNGEAVKGLEAVAIDVTGGWRFWVERRLPAAVTLKAGRNVLRLVNPSGHSLNLNGLRLLGPGRQEIYVRAVDFSGQGGGAVSVVKLTPSS
jgi:hypothetical protein